MVTELKSTFEQITERIRNPFIGAFVLCTLFINWELIFLLFNFDSGCTFNDKLALIDNYLVKNLGNNTCDKLTHVFFKPGIYAVLLLCFYSLGKFFFSAIITAYDAHIEPFMLRLVRQGGYELIQNFNALKGENRELHDKIIEIRTERNNLNHYIMEKEEELSQLKGQLAQSEMSLKEFNDLFPVLTNYKNEEADCKVATFDTVMRGTWKIEGTEGEFFVQQNQEMRNGNTFATFTHTYYNRRKNYLSFYRVLAKDGRTIENHLVQISQSLFVGFEKVGGEHKEIRYRKVQ